jgi:hypothetical protein
VQFSKKGAGECETEFTMNAKNKPFSALDLEDNYQYGINVCDVCSKNCRLRFLFNSNFTASNKIADLNFWIFFWRASVCWPLLRLGRPFCIFRDVWIRIQRAAVASRRATNLATHLPNLATQLPN